MKLIALTGMPGAGKGEVKRIILKAKEIPIVVMRTVVEDEMRSKGIEVNNRNLRNYATELRDKHGADIVARKCAPLIREKNSDVAIVDGIRGLVEVELFKKEFGDDFHLISVHTSPKVRFDRLRKRGKEWDMKEWDEFVFRDKKELSWGLGNAIAMADHVIINEGSFEELEKQVKMIMKEILGE
jgi:dephospho-CoA kinase